MTKKSKKTAEQTFAKHRAEIAERRAEIAKRMHVADTYCGFHILEIPAADGSPLKAWPGPFKTKRAAELFLDELLDAYAEGDPLSACDYYIKRIKELEQRAVLLEFLEEREGIADPRILARDLSQRLLNRYGFPTKFPI